MASNQTKNYKLSQWKASDRVLRADFNADNAKIDAALAAKANASDVGTLQNTVAALSKSLGGGGKNCRIIAGSYVGNGEYGKNKKITISGLSPWLVFITDGSISLGVIGIRSQIFSSSYGTYFQWDSTSVSWYSPNEGPHGCNLEGKTYHYMVLGFDPAS